MLLTESQEKAGMILSNNAPAHENIFIPLLLIDKPKQDLPPSRIVETPAVAPSSRKADKKNLSKIISIDKGKL